MIRPMFYTENMPADDVGVCSLSFLFLSLTFRGLSNSFHRANSISLLVLSILSARQGHIDLCLLLNLGSTRKVLKLNIFSCHATAQGAQWVASKTRPLFWDKLLAIVGEKRRHCHSSVTLKFWRSTE